MDMGSRFITPVHIMLQLQKTDMAIIAIDVGTAVADIIGRQ
tara:strand:- start:934 stop:1056 length:123 start_codon:yes stop_codon:yes gene_type:complete